ncbi:MAG: biotin synthase, partial [Archaeoglobi archaeon]|nr:biotin synthase [Archaeoglobi archaeon]
ALFLFQRDLIPLLASSASSNWLNIFWESKVYGSLKKFENLSHVCITGLNPIPGTPFEKRPMANPFEVAKVGAVARLVLRTLDISFGGMMNDPRLLPLWIMAGANRAIHLGAHVHRAGSWRIHHAGAIIERNGDVEFVNMLPLTTRIVREMGMEADVE